MSVLPTVIVTLASILPAPIQKISSAVVDALSGTEALATPQVTAEDASLAPGGTRGPGGIETIVQAHTTDVYKVDFKGGELALVMVSGDGDTDLDLKIYDENDNLVAQDIDMTDQCVASWTPRWTGTFRIEVINRGDVFNAYRMASN